MTARLPRFLEIVHRHALTGDEGFVMEPGFANFQPTGKGTPLARDARGTILAPFDARVLLPLYQGLGDDGFFLARDIAPFWLGVSSLARRLRLERWAHRLPGVTRHPTRPRTVVLTSPRQRRTLVGIFHLLGYRKLRPESGGLIMTRRAHDGSDL